MFKKNRWVFIVDNNKRGSRMLRADNNTRYEDFIEMVYEDYALDQRYFEVELSYMFPKKILEKLPQDTPPVYVVNCRQFQVFLEQAQSEVVRLCVEVKDKADSQITKTECRKQENWEANDHDNKIGSGKKCDVDLGKKNEDDDEDDDGARFDYCDDSDGTDSGDENFATYGMVPKEKEEDEEEEEKPKVDVQSGSPVFVGEGTENVEIANLEMSALELVVGQCYDTKEHLETRLKILSVVKRIDFDVYKSTPFLLTVKCWVKGCTWKVRATPIGDYPKFHIRKYVTVHSCSITERSARSRQATHEILGVLYKDFVGGVGPSVLPMHVAQALNKRFQIKVVTVLADLFAMSIYLLQIY